MNKKLIICTIVLFILTSFSCFCFATNVVNDVKNAVNDAGESVMNATNDAGNAMMDTSNNVQNGMDNKTNQASQTNSTNNNSYDASRTSTNTSTTLLGMNATMWTWLILGIAAVAIIALVWYYTSQNNQNFNSDDQ